MKTFRVISIRSDSKIVKQTIRAKTAKSAAAKAAGVLMSIAQINEVGAVVG